MSTHKPFVIALTHAPNQIHPWDLAASLKRAPGVRNALWDHSLADYTKSDLKEDMIFLAPVARVEKVVTPATRKPVEPTVGLTFRDRLGDTITILSVFNDSEGVRCVVYSDSGALGHLYVRRLDATFSNWDGHWDGHWPTVEVPGTEELRVVRLEVK